MLCLPHTAEIHAQLQVFKALNLDLLISDRLAIVNLYGGAKGVEALYASTRYSFI